MNDRDTDSSNEGTAPKIAVLRQKIHGLSADDYAETLRERLPAYEVEVARTPRDEQQLLSEAPIATGYTISEDAVSDSLELFACTFAGTDHLPMEALESRGVTVTSASGVHGPNVAEQVLGQALVFARRLDRGWRQGEKSTWRHYQAGELTGSTATIVGMGPIGQTVVDRFGAFDVETIGVRYTPSKGGPSDEVIGFDPADFHDALARTDYLVLACPLTGVTEGLVDDEAFMTLPTDAVLINVARGPVVETEALLEALRGNEIRGAALDVTDPEPLPADHPLWLLDNCHITPHNAGHTPNYWDRCADILADALDAAGGRI